MRVLIIEDDILYATNISKSFKKYGILSDICHLGREGINLFKNIDYDVILVDLLLPDINGNDIIKTIRSLPQKKKSNVPIITISGQNDLNDILKSFMEGTDDYLKKPFDVRELVMRVRNKVCRQRGITSNIIVISELTVNLDTRKVFVNSNEIKLTETEYSILELLILRKNSPANKQVIFDNLYARVNLPGKKIIDVIICKIRRKIQQYSDFKYIETVWGVGYRICDPYQDQKNEENLEVTDDSEHNLDEDNFQVIKSDN